MKQAAATGAGLALPVSVRAMEPQAAETAPHTSPAALNASSADATRGIGIYPGAPSEYTGPTLIPAGNDYRNLALLRPAYHSSSYDFNLTAQLVTDGITSTEPPQWTSVSADDRVLDKDEREVLFDHFLLTSLNLTGPLKTVDIHLGGGSVPPTIDRMGIFVQAPKYIPLGSIKFTIYASEDSHTWRPISSSGALKTITPAGYSADFTDGWSTLSPTFIFDRPEQARFYRVELDAGSRSGQNQYMPWRLAEVTFFNKSQQLEMGGPYRFSSAWKSAGAGTEWVYVDLGTASTFDRVKLHWIAPPTDGVLQISNNAVDWHEIHPLTSKALTDDLQLKVPARARYVRALLTRPATAEGYVLSELEIFGRGGLIARPKAATPPDGDGTVQLSGGAWRLHRAGALQLDGKAMSSPGPHLQQGLVATVPGTVLTSYLNAGALPDPNFGQNQLYLSDSYFYSDFWYTTELPASTQAPDKLSWLNFDGVNWNAEVFLNGERLGEILGGFRRKRFNITGKLHADQPNVLAVRIEKNRTPGSMKQKSYENVGKNGGALGADNPTYHASAGWDWMPTIRGRNTGIWGPVTLSTTGIVTVADPAVSTTLPLPQTDRAAVTLSAALTNHTSQQARGTLHARFGDISLSQPITLAANSEKRFTFDPSSHPQLMLKDPQLWWPTGYGEPHLYAVELDFEPEGQPLQRGLRFQAGVRQIVTTEDGGALRIFINGRRLIPKGGNWGFSESMLRYRAREYDAAVRYHREMNFNILRNWVGQIGDDALYEACDRHGILVWHDFWLANPADGPEPDNDALFLDNARDVIQRFRMHPSIVLYCGRNEGIPPPTLEQGLRSLLAELHPGALYISSSADGPVSGRGPYHGLTPDAYFRNEDLKFHSEIGAPNIPTLESVEAMMPASSMWPKGLDWGLHDFCLTGAQGGLTFLSLIDNNYGGADNAKDWIELAQFLNYDTYRAMFEAQSQHRMGVLLWMSHPAWPSFVWQTYDYYLEPTAAYFGCKKAAEPLHIQWNSATDHVEVVNSSAGAQRGLSAVVEVLGPQGKVLSQQSATLDSLEDSVASPIAIQFPSHVDDVHLLRLTLKQSDRILSTNTYLRGREAANLRAIRTWDRARVVSTTATEQTNGTWRLTTQLRNTGTWTALLVRLKAVRNTSGDRILPAIYSDNYLTLLPGETRTIVTELNQADTRGEHPRIIVSGFNLA